MFGVAARGIPSFGDLSWKKPCDTNAGTPLPAYTASPSSGIAIGQTLTANVNGSINTAYTPWFSNGITVSVGSRILVASETPASLNGIYTITQVGDASHPWVMTRATDADTLTETPVGTCVDVIRGAFSTGTGQTVYVKDSSGFYVTSPSNLDSLVAGAAYVKSGRLTSYVPLDPLRIISGATFGASDATIQTLTLTGLPTDGSVFAAQIELIAATNAAGNGNVIQLFNYGLTTNGVPAMALYIQNSTSWNNSIQGIVSTGGTNNIQLQYKRLRNAGTITWFLDVVGYWGY